MPRTYGKAKQTRLAFAPIALPSEDDDEMARQATLRYGHPSRPTLSFTGSKGDRSSRRNTSDPFVGSPSAEGNEATSEEGARRSRSKKNKKEKKKDAKEKDEKKVKSKKEKSDKKKDRKNDKKKKKNKQEKTETPPTPPSPTPEPIAPVELSSDNELEILSSVRKNRTTKRKRSPSPEQSKPPSPNDEDPPAQGDNDDDDVVARPRRKLLRRGPAQPAPVVLDDSSDDSDEPVASSPVKRRRRNVSVEEPQTPRRNVDQDQLDLEEDLEDLQDSVVKQSRTRGRAANSARAQRQKHLETLRRRRAGQTETDEEQSASESEAAPSENNSSESEEEDEEEAVRQPRIPFATEDSDVESEIASNEDLDRYDKDFVLDDDDDKLGVPAGLAELPIQFSRHAYKQLKDYFQDAVEWMVLNQLFPAFERSSPIYKVAFDKLEDEVKGRTGSQLVSSVWNADFCRALMARPHLEETTFPTIEGHPCDACKRSGHPASYDLKFYGKAYSLETLEPLSDSDSDEERSETEEDGLERDRDGHVLPDEDTRFYLGRHCKGRATMAHTLTHWRFHLNEWVVDHLKRMGHVSDEKVLERSHWSQKRRARYAGEAFREMVDGGEVKKLWRDFHINLRTARESTTLG